MRRIMCFISVSLHSDTELPIYLSHLLAAERQVGPSGGVSGVSISRLELGTGLNVITGEPVSQVRIRVYGGKNEGPGLLVVTH